MKVGIAIASIVLSAGAVLAAPAPPAPPGGPGAPRPPMMGPMHGGHGMPGRAGMHGRMPGRRGGMHVSPAGMILMHRQQLNLSDDQARRLEQLHVDMQKAMIRATADMRIAHIDLMQLATQANPDQKRIEQAVRALGQQVTDLGLLVVRNYFESRNVLNEAQRTQVQEMLRMMISGGMGGCPPGGCPMGGGMMGGGPMGGGMMGGPMGGGAGGTGGQTPTP